MKKCPNCGAELDDDVRFCPDCGEPLVGKRNRGGRKGIGCGGIFKVLKVLVFIVIVVIFLIAKKNGGVNLKDNTTTASVSRSAQVQATAQPKTNSANTGGVDPDLKAWLDSYESFMDQYVAFMKSYDGSSSTALLNYAAMMAKYADFTEKLDEWDTEEMSSADYSYYLTVVNRVNTKLLSAY